MTNEAVHAGGEQAGALHCAGVTGEMVLMELLDAVIDRNADILERASGDMDTISHDITQWPEAPRVPATAKPLFRSQKRSATRAI